MRAPKSLVLTLAVVALAAIGLSIVSSAENQNPNPTGNPVKIIGLGLQTSLPTKSDGTPYLPVRGDDRQTTFGAEQWQNSGSDIAPLLLNGSVLPKQVTICGHRLSMIQGGLMNSTTDDNYFFPMTVNGTRIPVPDDGCYSITPVAYLRIKGIVKIPRDQITNAIVTATY